MTRPITTTKVASHPYTNSPILLLKIAIDPQKKSSWEAISLP